MKIDEEQIDYKLENSYIGKLGFKVRSYVPYYNSEDTIRSIQESITKSCLKIYENIKKWQGNIGVCIQMWYNIMYQRKRMCT